MIEIIEEARRLAKTAHAGQFYGTGDPYFTHLEQVANMARKLGYCDEVVAASYLHDIVEDTSVTIEDLGTEFPESVVNAVESVTFAGNDYAAKIEKVKTNSIGIVVKFCDASCNYANAVIFGEKPGRKFDEVILRRAGYISSLLIVLPTPTDIENYLAA